MNDALELSRQSIEKTLDHYNGEENSRVYFFRFTYACILFDNNEIQTDLRLHHEILEFRTKDLGEEHTHTAASYYFVGYIYYTLSAWEKAECVSSQGIDIPCNLLTAYSPMLRNAIRTWGAMYKGRERVARAQFCLYLVL